MSKMDDLRRMREAKYEAAQKSGPKPGGNARRAPLAPVDSPSDPSEAPTGETETDALCGHRSMNGRTCTREAGHAAKNHRYS